MHSACRLVIQGNYSPSVRIAALYVFAVLTVLIDLEWTYLEALAFLGAGIFGVTAYAVEQRTKEIGIRMALGALKSQALSPILRQSLTSVLTGAAIGTAGGFGEESV